MTTMAPALSDTAQTWPHGGEPISVTDFRHAYFPLAFLWRDTPYAVQAVERCWTESGRAWLGRATRITRHYFLVRCAEGRYTLCLDVRRNTWTITEGV